MLFYIQTWVAALIKRLKFFLLRIQVWVSTQSVSWFELYKINRIDTKTVNTKISQLHISNDVNPAPNSAKLEHVQIPRIIYRAILFIFTPPVTAEVYCKIPQLKIY